jgi:hypothetical protein
MVTERITEVFGEKSVTLPLCPRRFHMKCRESEPGPLSEEKTTNCMSYGTGVTTKSNQVSSSRSFLKCVGCEMRVNTVTASNM